MGRPQRSAAARKAEFKGNMTSSILNACKKSGKKLRKEPNVAAGLQLIRCRWGQVREKSRGKHKDAVVKESHLEMNSRPGPIPLRERRAARKRKHRATKKARNQQ